MQADRTLEHDLTDYSLYVDGFPHDLFTELRGQRALWRHGPAQLRESFDRPEGATSEEFWVLLSHPLIQQANRDWETFSAQRGPTILASPPQSQGHTLVSSDPPDHTRLRRLISSGFTPRMVARLDEKILHFTTGILDEVVERGGEVDFVREVAYVLPMQMIAEIVGIPVEDRPAIFDDLDVTFRSRDPRNDLTPADHLAAMMRLHQYAQALGEEKRRHPTEDVWSILARAQVGEGGEEALTVSELDQFFTILGIAGSETTRNAITAGLRAFIDHPDQFERLRADPSLIDPATDEIIRWASPVTMFAREATRDVELDGVRLRAGERITMWYPSGNRDVQAFEDPFRFDVARRPNPHVSFGGGGVHYCLGANLAKREVNILFEELARRFSGAELTGPPVFCTPGEVIAATADHLPVRLVERRG